MKSRELLKRIRKTVSGEKEGQGSALFGLGEELLDGSEVDGAQVADAALSPCLGGGTRLIVVRDAHALKGTEALEGLLGPAAEREQLMSVCVFLSKDLDGRKKFSKLLTERAAVVPCDEVPEADREAWIGYLAKRKGLALSRDLLLQLIALDPWSLDIIEQELEKYSLASEDVVLRNLAPQGGSDAFLDAFFRKDLRATLEQVEGFADRPDESLPLLGLFSWNVRQLALLIADREQGTRNAKLNPYLADKLKRWAQGWSLAEIIRLQSELAELDFGIKQTPLLPLGLWNSLSLRTLEPGGQI
jgi:DNA polymerase III delta subunit